MEILSNANANRIGFAPQFQNKSYEDKNENCVEFLMTDGRKVRCSKERLFQLGMTKYPQVCVNLSEIGISACCFFEQILNFEQEIPNFRLVDVVEVANVAKELGMRRVLEVIEVGLGEEEEKMMGPLKEIDYSRDMDNIDKLCIAVHFEMETAMEKLSQRIATDFQANRTVLLDYCKNPKAVELVMSRIYSTPNEVIVPPGYEDFPRNEFIPRAPPPPVPPVGVQNPNPNNNFNLIKNTMEKLKQYSRIAANRFYPENRNPAVVQNPGRGRFAEIARNSAVAIRQTAAVAIPKIGAYFNFRNRANNQLQQ